ncbi:MAG: cytidine deaminase [Cyanobacteria bacterium J06553_1]
MNIITEAQQTQLWEQAQQACQNAYAPYSQFQVGAAVLTEQGTIFTGCNVENVSYGLTICAERNAIAAAVATVGGHKMKIRAIAITNNRQLPCSPCGACRQVIAEFADKNTIVIFLGQQGIEISTITELLPHGFSF